MLMKLNNVKLLQNIVEFKMNRLDQVLLIAETINVSKKTANIMLNTIVNNITQALEKGEKVTLVGFGTFKKLNEL